MENEKEFGEIFNISKGETTSINNGFLKITFTGHELNEPGYTFPLIIFLEYEFENKKYETSYYMNGDIPFIWKWNKFLFVVVDYKYNQFMTMKTTIDLQ